MKISRFGLTRICEPIVGPTNYKSKGLRMNIPLMYELWKNFALTEDKPTIRLIGYTYAGA